MIAICSKCKDPEAYHHPETKACWDQATRQHSPTNVFEAGDDGCRYCSEPLTDEAKRVYPGVTMHETCYVQWRKDLAAKRGGRVAGPSASLSSTETIASTYLGGHIPSTMEVSLLWAVEKGYITTDEAIRIALSHTLAGDNTTDDEARIVRDPS